MSADGFSAGPSEPEMASEVAPRRGPARQGRVEFGLPPESEDDQHVISRQGEGLFGQIARIASEDSASCPCGADGVAQTPSVVALPWAKMKTRRAPAMAPAPASSLSAST